MNKSTRTRVVILSLAAVLIAAGIAAYRKYSGDATPRYRTESVETGSISQSVSANGTINPVTLVSVGTQVSGTVKKLYVDYNSKVRKGQVLLELDNSLLAAQLNQSEANVQNAQATLELSTANEIRMRDLYAQDYVSRQELDSAVQSKKSAEAQLLASRAQRDKDRANLSYSVIRSPVSGVVVDRQVDVGQTVAASLQTPTLFKIAQDLSKMQIDSNFAEADIGNIQVGQTVHFTVDAFPNRNFKGVVSLIRLNPTTISNVVTYDVVIGVSNPDQILLPGMTAYVNITVAERKDTLLVPNAALRYKPTNWSAPKQASPAAGKSQAGSPPGGGKPKRDAYSGRVFVLESGQLKPVNVTLGITDNRNTEITGGELKVGDQVIVGDAQSEKPASSGRPPMRMF